MSSLNELFHDETLADVSFSLSERYWPLKVRGLIPYTEEDICVFGWLNFRQIAQKKKKATSYQRIVFLGGVGAWGEMLALFIYLYIY